MLLNCCEEKGKAIFARPPRRAAAEQVVCTGAPGVPVGAGSEENWAPLRCRSFWLGWAQNWWGPVSEVAPEQPGDSLGCSAALQHHYSRCLRTGHLIVLAPCSTQFVWLFLSIDKEVDITSSHPCLYSSVGLWSLGPCPDALIPLLKGSHCDSLVFWFVICYFNVRGSSDSPFPAPLLFKAIRCVEVLLIFCWVFEHPLGCIQDDVCRFYVATERQKTSFSEIKEILI